jgi:hypothetical protein
MNWTWPENENLTIFLPGIGQGQPPRHLDELRLCEWHPACFVPTDAILMVGGGLTPHVSGRSPKEGECIEPGGWDHEHCSICHFKFLPKDDRNPPVPGFVDERGSRWLCERCHAALELWWSHHPARSWPAVDRAEASRLREMVEPPLIEGGTVRRRLLESVAGGRFLRASSVPLHVMVRIEFDGSRKVVHADLPARQEGAALHYGMWWPEAFCDQCSTKLTDWYVHTPRVDAWTDGDDVWLCDPCHRLLSECCENDPFLAQARRFSG